MNHDASHSYTGACPERSRRDAENRITQVDSGSTATHTYGADGRRFSKTARGVETDFFYDLSGHVVADYGGGSGITTWHAGYVYFNGQPLAEYFGPTYFYVTDHLGSTRLLTNYNGPTVIECDDYYPFGELVSCGGTSTTTHKFTGKERDSESNLDNFGARYDSSAMGRFMSPDPKPISTHLPDPQGFNRYTYVRDNPLVLVDPDGKDWQQALADLKEAGKTIYARATVGFGLGAKVDVGPAEVKVEVAVKANLRFSGTEGKLSATEQGEAGVVAGPKGSKQRVGLGGSVEQTKGSVDLNTGKLGPEEAAHAEVTTPIGTTSYGVDPSSNEVGLEEEEGEGLLGGGGIGLTKAGWAKVGDAVVDIFTKTPPPPPPPTPPSAPCGGQHSGSTAACGG